MVVDICEDVLHKLKKSSVIKSTTNLQQLKNDN